MITETINNGVVYITIDNSTYSFPTDLNGIKECDELLSKISIKELYDLLKSHCGISKDFLEYIKKKIKLYGNSLEVESFICEGNKVWLTKDQRSSIINLINLNKTLTNEDTFELILHDKVHKISYNEVIDLISKLELYSYKCLITLTKHLENIDKITNLKDLFDYDYTEGYPDKIILK